MKTVEAEVTLQAHPQRAPVGGSGAKSGAANGPPRAGGKGRPEYPLTHCLRYGQMVCLHHGERPASGKQGGTADKYLFVLDRIFLSRAFSILGGFVMKLNNVDF